MYRGKLHNGIQVAIKTMRIQILSSDESQKPLKVSDQWLQYPLLISLQNAARELHTWSKCQHPNVLKLLGVVQFRDQIGMVAEWMGNGSLIAHVLQQPAVDRCRLVRTLHIIRLLFADHAEKRVYKYAMVLHIYIRLEWWAAWYSICLFIHLGR